MTEPSDLLAMSVRDFAAATAAKKPTPGGGSVAGVVGALGVALGEMSLNFTRGKKKYAEHAEAHERLATRLAHARAMFFDLVADDVAAYEMYTESTRADDGPEKDQAVQLAVAAAIDVPRQATKLALAVLGDLQDLADKCNPYLHSDLVAAAVLASAAVALCDFNVRVNAPQVDDAQAAADILQASAADRLRAAGLVESIEQALRDTLG